MSEEGQDRTEPASPRRLEEARKQGQVAFSPDFLGSALLLAGVVGMTWLAPTIAGRLEAYFVQTCRSPMPHEIGEAETAAMLGDLLLRFVLLAGPLLALLAAVGVGISVAQVGFHITPERLEPDFEHLSPAKGMAKLFSMGALVKGLLALVKIAVLGALVLAVLRARAGVFTSLGHGDAPSAAAHGWGLTMRLALYLAMAFAALGVADFAFQRYRLESSLRMTKQEVKEEMKREDGDPEMKARRRQRQRELGQRRTLNEVPKATLVLTNPTHVAVALRYQRGVMRAPKVIARGAGAFARRIVEAARRNGVPVLERPALARALYRSVDVGREIPPELFVAIAEVIAFVFKLRGIK